MIQNPNSLLMWLVTIALSALTSIASAQRSNQDLMGSHLIPPEIIVQHREAIDLTEDQLKRIRRHVESVDTLMPSLHQRVEQETLAMVELLSAGKVDESAAIKQLQQVLEAEQAIKQLHLKIMIRIRNELTSEQIQKLADEIDAVPFDSNNNHPEAVQHSTLR